MTARLLTICAALAATFVGVQQLHLTAAAPERSVVGFPTQVNGWTAGPDVLFDSDVERLLKADNYINRDYQRDGTSLSVYVGYHRTQTEGAAIHSPLNCLPGAGWLPTSRRIIDLDGQGSINLVTVQKGADRQVVVYWYQTATRVIAGEYKSRAYLVLDSLTSGRRDAALVRIMAPLSGSTESNLRLEGAVASFAEMTIPLVNAELFSARTQ